MSTPSERPPLRPSSRDRLARRRTLRRRRLAALVAIGLATAIAVGASLAFTRGGGKSSAQTQTQTEKTQRQDAKEKAEKQRKAKAAAHMQRALEAKADLAAARYAEIGLPLYCGGGKKNLVALTFDDGPSQYTERDLLPVLGARHARATFFILGRHISNYPNAILKEVRHGALGDHTWNHSSLPGLNRFALKAELGDTQRELQRAIGKPIRLFRPPYGAHDAMVDQQVKAYGMLQVLWSIDSHDWNGLSATAMTNRILAIVKPGSIVLMHDIHPNTIEALPTLVRALHHRGFRLVTIPEMLVLDPPSMRQLSLGAAGCE
jgi:peptidoglycan-N-acetylglucosamine deacetylase